MINPIEKAVAPLKKDAIKAARTYAENISIMMLDKIKQADGDINAAYPYPSSSKMSRAEYVSMAQDHHLACRLTVNDPKRDNTNRMYEPRYVVRCHEGVQNFIEDAGRNAAAQYDAFVIKLTKKIGTAKTAKLDGNHVWSYSLLNVTFADKPAETWKTRSIVNMSKLGKVFNQWPTRKVKGAR